MQKPYLRWKWFWHVQGEKGLSRMTPRFRDLPEMLSGRAIYWEGVGGKRDKRRNLEEVGKGKKSPSVDWDFLCLLYIQGTCSKRSLGHRGAVRAGNPVWASKTHRTYLNMWDWVSVPSEWMKQRRRQCLGWENANIFLNVVKLLSKRFYKFTLSIASGEG